MRASASVVLVLAVMSVGCVDRAIVVPRSELDEVGNGQVFVEAPSGDRREARVKEVSPQLQDANAFVEPYCFEWRFGCVPREQRFEETAGQWRQIEGWQRARAEVQVYEPSGWVWMGGGALVGGVAGFFVGNAVTACDPGADDCLGDDAQLGVTTAFVVGGAGLGMLIGEGVHEWTAPEYELAR